MIETVVVGVGLASIGLMVRRVLTKQDEYGKDITILKVDVATIQASMPNGEWEEITKGIAAVREELRDFKEINGKK